MQSSPSPRRMARRKRVVVPILGATILVIAAVIGLGILDHRAGAPRAVATQPTNRALTPAASPQPAAFDSSRFSTTDPASLWVVVNKSHPLSTVDYAPTDLVTAYGVHISSRMQSDLAALMADSAKDGVGLTLVSGYRSYDYQRNLYASYVATDGQEKADRYSARPGYSEHQTGLAVDFGDKAGKCTVEDCYADLPEAKWLADNAYKYGFLLRYTADDQDATGYQAEAWHYRYVGRDLAGELRTKNIPTLEQFFAVTGGANYVP